MRLTTAQKWRRILAWLHRNFPAQNPIYVKSIPIKKFHGYTEFWDKDFDININEKWFQIKIKREQSFNLKIDTLIHEWAHCLSWFGADQHEYHSAEWGLAYARIYRTFIEWDYGRKK